MLPMRAPALLLPALLLISLPGWAELPASAQAASALPASARQLRLEAFRSDQEACRTYKHEARRERLESKRARLADALAAARDQVQAECLHLLAAQPAPAGKGSGPSFRSACIGLAGLCLLAGDATASGQMVGIEVLPPSRVVAQFSGGPETAGQTGTGPYEGLAQTLTDLLMARLASDELDPTRPALQRALQAQRTLLGNALDAVLGSVPPAPATPGAQLLRGAFASALDDTAQDVLNDLLPPGFGPLPGRRAPPPQAEPGEPEAVTQARAELAAARKEVAAAVREAKGVGSDIVVAATSLLGYGAFASVAYGLDIGASITGIFTSTPVTGAGVATGTLSATANGFFLMAYASDAIAGAVTIHKLKEPYIDALLRVSDAEAAWVKALTTYTELRDQPRPAPATGTAAGTASAPAAGTSTGTPTAGTGATGPAEPAGSGTLAADQGPAAATPAVATAAERTVSQDSPTPDGQASAATRSAGPFWTGW